MQSKWPRQDESVLPRTGSVNRTENVLGRILQGSRTYPNSSLVSIDAGFMLC